jgi:hypothetical protein
MNFSAFNSNLPAKVINPINPIDPRNSAATITNLKSDLLSSLSSGRSQHTKSTDMQPINIII